MEDDFEALDELENEDSLEHIGIIRRSGRYPWGSGGPENVSVDPYKRNKTFLDHVDILKSQGLSEAEIAKGMGISTTRLRAARSIARNEVRAADQAFAFRLKEKGVSNVEIGTRMGINESSVRSLLDPRSADKGAVLQETANALRRQIEEKTYLDVGAGTALQLGINDSKMATAVALLEEEGGYKKHFVKVQQVGTGKETTYIVLTKEGVPYSEVFANRDKIQTPKEFTDDGGRTWTAIQPPVSVSADRVAVRYAEDGGANADGVIYIRPGVADVALGGSKYAQVRIAVNDTHFLKGMAVYKDDLPDGVDLEFNTNKSSTGNKLDAMKKLKVTDDGKVDPDLPFGSVIRQKTFIDADGKQKLSPMNIVNEEGNWNDWSRTLSSQVLSKQSSVLAKEQLDLAYSIRKAEFDTISGLTNPAVKRKLLDSFADGTDSASVHLKAASLPRQKTQVILPINSLKDNEIYAPNFRPGERVSLVRYPHGGTFEIPELTVNNKNPEARRILGTDAIDAVGINAKVASRLSGADFDGDTVLVIPNSKGRLQSSAALEGLKNFDPQAAYPAYDGMKTIDGGVYNAKAKKVEYPDKPPNGRQKQIQMGDVSNLITDMTIRRATRDELARAVRHSMVVIDSEKHALNWKQSKTDNGIPQLKAKYQNGPRSGATTLISRASRPVRVPERIPRKASNGGPIDKATGKKVYEDTGDGYVNKQGKAVTKSSTVKELDLYDNAYDLSSGTRIEAVYASHSNKLKSLADTARKTSVNTANTPYSPSAKRAYSNEVASLDRKLRTALENAPRERQAQLLANARISAIKQSNPDLTQDKLKKVKSQALTEARIRAGAKKVPVDITPTEWAAIQAGAITNNKLSRILDNADLDAVKKLAMPNSVAAVNTATLARARSMLAAGYTQSEISDFLGVPTSTLNDAIREDQSGD